MDLDICLICSIGAERRSKRSSSAKGRISIRFLLSRSEKNWNTRPLVRMPMRAWVAAK